MFCVLGVQPIDDVTQTMVVEQSNLIWSNIRVPDQDTVSVTWSRKCSLSPHVAESTLTINFKGNSHVVPSIKH